MNQAKVLKKETSTAHHVKAKVYSLKTESNVVGDLIGIDQVLADSKIYIRNWKIPGSQDIWPQHPQMRQVDKYYPYAKGGPLLVDQPFYNQDIEACERKAKKLKELGHRYLILKKDMTLDEGYLQLGGK